MRVTTRPTIWLAVSLLAGSTLSAMAQTDRDSGQEQWSVYRSPSSGTTVDYPTGIFAIKEGEPEKGDGQRFRTSDGRAALVVYGLPNEQQDTPQAYLDRRLLVDKSSLDYSRVTNRFFAISGFRNDSVFYSRCNFSTRPDARIHCIYLEYPVRETKSWDAVVTRISRSLHGPTG